MEMDIDKITLYLELGRLEVCPHPVERIVHPIPHVFCNFDLNIITKLLIYIIKRFPGLTVQNFNLFWGNAYIHRYRTTL